MTTRRQGDPAEPSVVVTERAHSRRRTRTTGVFAVNPTTVFIGRARELAFLAGSFREATLVTLHGPPGVGKTRLVREHCAKMSGDEVPVYWCDAGAARTVDALCSALSVALDISHPGASSLADRVEHLCRCIAAADRGLLVVDGVEHPAHDTRVLLPRLLAARPTVQILLTSREPLGVAGEIAFAVERLAVPDERETNPERILRADSVQLLCERASAVRSTFRASAQDAPVLAEITRALDGIPLALELAAAQLDLIDLLELRDRMTDHLGGSQAHARNLPRAQVALETAFGWSWQTLSPVERDALVQSSVFAEGFTLDAARCVLDLGGADVAATLRSLREKSLLFTHESVESAAAARLRPYDCVRTFVIERAGVPDQVQARHARYFAQAFEPSSAAIGAGSSVHELARVRAERANVVAAFRWASAKGVFDLARQLALAVAPVLSTSGLLDDLCDLLDAALTDLPHARGAQVSPALIARGDARRRKGLIEAAIEDLEHSIARATDPRVEVIARCTLARTYLDLGRRDHAWAELSRAESLARRSGFARGCALALAEMASMELASMRSSAARDLFERCFAAARDARDLEMEARALLNLGILLEGQPRGAATLDNLRQAHELFAALGDHRSAAIALYHRGIFETERGRYAEARELHRRAAEVFFRIGDHIHLGLAEGNLGLATQAQAGVAAGGAHLQRACEFLAGGGPVAAEPLFRAALGASLAAHGQLDAAEEEFMRVDRLLQATDREGGDRSTAIYRAHLEQARAVDAAARGQLELAAEHRRRAELAAERGRDLIEHDAGREFHSDVRLALHVWATTAPAPAGGQERIVICPEGTWFRMPGADRVDLHHRRPLRRILNALVEAWLRSPGTAVPIDSLVRSAWPDQTLAAKTGASRIYVAIGELRSLGLRGALLQRGTGYLLDHNAPIAPGHKPQ